MHFKTFLVCMLFVSALNYAELSDIDSHPSWNYLPMESCGYGGFTDRIVGGREASLGQYPWIARIGYKIRPQQRKLFYLCAGSLINQWYVLTAVHCFLDILGETISSVRIGENFAKTTIDCEGNVCAPPVQDFNIGTVIKYSNYQGTTLSVMYGDVGLIKLADPVMFNEFVMPICLPRGDIVDHINDYLRVGTKLEVAGWGTTDEEFGGRSPNKLIFVKVPVVNLDTCQAVFHPNLIDESQICAGEGGGKDSCVGDSGGPLMKVMVLDGPPQYFIVGLVSYGMKACGASSAVYTNVTHYLEWILDQIDE